ncbi:MAG TPA: DUF262 domain-containing protein, partial [Myxococcales bacterium]|nr:DUF262 domain-containing protein [Myxococcales bacterium]
NDCQTRAQEAEPSSRFERISEAIDEERGFGLIDEDTVLRAVLARRGGDVTREIRLEFGEHTQAARDFPGGSAESAYREGERALSRAVAFLQEEVGVPHFVLLPYRYLLVVLARFFAHYPEPSPGNRALLRRWFWRAALAGPVTPFGSWTFAMRTLATRISADDETGSIQRLLELPRVQDFALPKLTQFRTSNADSRIVLCALWSLGPRSFTTREPYTRQNLVDAIPPGGTTAEVVERILRVEPEGHHSWAANRIVSLEEGQRNAAANLLQLADSLFDRQEARAVLASHAVSEEQLSALARGDAVGFLKGRQRLIEQAVRDFLSRITETQFEDTPPLDSLNLDDPDEERDDSVA